MLQCCEVLWIMAKSPSSLRNFLPKSALKFLLQNRLIRDENFDHRGNETSLGATFDKHGFKNLPQAKSIPFLACFKNG